MKDSPQRAQREQRKNRLRVAALRAARYAKGQTALGLPRGYRQRPELLKEL